MLTGTHLIGFGAGGSAAQVTLEFGAGATSSSNNNHSFTSHSIGTPGANRHVVVCVVVPGSITINSVTVGGQSATAVVNANNSSSTRAAIFVTDAPVASGSTATIAIGLSSFSVCGIATYAVSSIASTTAADTKSTTTDNAALNLSVPAGGVGIGVASTGSGTATYSVTNGTEDYDVGFGSILTICSAHTTTTGTVALAFDASVSISPIAVAASFI